MSVAKTRFHTMDPMRLKDLLWPDVVFYKEQKEIIYSVWNNVETYVRAGNELGKDFTSGFLALAFFLTRYPCRIVTTSAKDDHLRVRWGEINRFIQTSKIPLDARKGGPLICNHQDIRLVVNGERCPISYLTAQVASADSIAAMQGHHVADIGDGIPRTLFLSDESSSVMDDYYKMAVTWAQRILAIGNPWPCNNFYRRGCDGGDVPHPVLKERLLRKVIHIAATDSPNVRYAIAQILAGEEPTGEMLVPGVKSYLKYVTQKEVWDLIQRTVCLEGNFYEGAELKLFPLDWLRLAQRRYRELNLRKREARAMGIDPAQGGDKTAWAIVDDHGLMKLISKKTPDTTVIPEETIELGKLYNIPPENWVFDIGGGGKQHADLLRKRGYRVRTVSFGESPSLMPRRGLTSVEERINVRENKQAYTNMRAEMYWNLSDVLNPANPTPFTIPDDCPNCEELIRQLRPIPREYDSEGKAKMLPKDKRSSSSTEKTLTELIGCSPDEADSVVLALHGRDVKARRARAGVT